MSLSGMIVARTYAKPYNNYVAYCTSMHLYFVHCELFDVKHWNINEIRLFSLFILHYFCNYYTNNCKCIMEIKIFFSFHFLRVYIFKRHYRVLSNVRLRFFAHEQRLPKTGPTKSTLVKVPHCWKSRVTAHIVTGLPINVFAGSVYWLLVCFNGFSFN